MMKINFLNIPIDAITMKETLQRVENAIADNCGLCDIDATNDCTQDCEGIWGGNFNFR